MEFLHDDAFQIARRFAQAGQSYDEHAIIQKKIAHTLFDLMQQNSANTVFDRVLEIGCGSGNLSKVFLEHMMVKTLYLNDLYVEVQQHFDDHSAIEWCIGDAEKITFPDALELFMSSSALQWMQDLDGILNKSADVLQDQALICFSTFGQENLKEIKALTQHGLAYLTLTEIQDKVEQAGFEVLHISEQVEALFFKHPKHVLEHLKATGVTATGAKFRWNKQSLAAFYQGYRRFIATDEHENLVYPLSYHPIYVIARRMK